MAYMDFALPNTRVNGVHRLQLVETADPNAS
jgi:hypothetical protein